MIAGESMVDKDLDESVIPQDSEIGINFETGFRGVSIMPSPRRACIATAFHFVSCRFALNWTATGYVKQYLAW